MKNFFCPRAVFLFLAITSFLTTDAERLNNNAEVYEQPGKATIGQLYKGTNIYVADETNGWAKIIAIAQIPAEGFDEYTLEMPKRTILYNTAGTEIGKMYGKQKLQGLYSYGDSEVLFEVIGYVRTTQIDSLWIPEKTVAKIIDSANSKVMLADLLPEITRYGFFVDIEEGSFRAFELQDIPGLNFNNPVKRLTLVFYEDRLVAIFHKNRFVLKSKEVIQVDGRENLIYLRDLNAEEKREFSRLFLQ